MDLLVERAALVEHHKKLEYAPQSPFHPRNLPPGELPPSERPFGIQIDDEIFIVGDCVPKVKAVLVAFLARVDGPDREEYEERARVEPTMAQCIAKCRKHVAENGREMRMGGQTWNALGIAFAEQKFLVGLHDGKKSSFVTGR